GDRLHLRPSHRRPGGGRLRRVAGGRPPRAESGRHRRRLGGADRGPGMTESRYTPEALSVDIDPHLFVVFGGTGDLARSKLLPALYRLLSSRGFSDSVQLLGVASRDITDDEYRSLVGAALAAADLAVDEEWLGHSVHFQSLRHGFEALGERIREVEEAAGLGGNRAFYLAVPPDVFDETVEGLGKVGVVDGPGWSRVVVE